MWTIFVAFAGWIAGWLVFGRPLRLIEARSISPACSSSEPAMPKQAEGDRPKLSVIIPARDEETSIGALLADLAAHAPAATEVIVVNDESTDTTAAIARSAEGVTLLDACERPSGWAGKPWACHVGAQTASADTLCFVDADVRLNPGALEALCDAHDHDGGLVSVQPWHHTQQPYEQGSALFGVVALMGAGTGKQGDHPCAFGPVIITARDDYDLIGGHAAVQSEVVEDVALARAYAEKGLAVNVFTGSDLVEFRMYPDGPRSMFEGWTKNFASGAANTPLWRLGSIVLWLSAMGTAFSLAWEAVVGTGPAIVGLGAFAAFVGQLRAMFTQVGRFGWLTALTYPVLMVTFFVVFFRSLWCTVVRREVRWRDRCIPIHAVGVPGSGS